MAVEPTASNIGQFRNIRAGIDLDGFIDGISFEWLNTDTSSWSSAFLTFNKDTSLARTPTGADHLLAALRDAWDAGTVVAGDITVGKSGSAGYAALVRNEYPNPLDRHAWERWNNSQNIRLRFGRYGDLDDSGLTVADRVQTEARSEMGGTVDLYRWTHQRYSNEDVLRLVFDDGTFVTDAVPLPAGRIAFADHTDIKAMVAWLNSVRNIGDPVPADLGSLTGRSFVSRSSPFSNVTLQKHKAGARITHVSLHIPAGSQPITGGGNLRTPSFEALAVPLSEPVTVDSATAVMVPQLSGSTDSPVQGNELRLTNEVRLSALNRQPVFSVRDGGPISYETHVPVGRLRIVDHDALSEVSGQTYRWVPTPGEVPLLGAVHYYGDSPAGLRLRTPHIHCDQTGIATPLDILNDGSSTYEVFDWDGNSIVLLAAGEHAELKMLWDHEGHGHLFGTVAPRYHSAIASDIGSVVQAEYYSFSATEWIAIPAVAGTDHIDADAFEVGTQTTSGGSAWPPTAVTPRMLKVLKPGILDFSQLLDVEITGTGSLNAHSSRLYLRRGTARTLIDTNEYAAVSGPDAYRSYRWAWRGRVQAGDILEPGVVYPKGASLNWGASQARGAVRTATLDQEIRRKTTS